MLAVGCMLTGLPAICIVRIGVVGLSIVSYERVLTPPRARPHMMLSLTACQRLAWLSKWCMIMVCVQCSEGCFERVQGLVVIDKPCHIFPGCFGSPSCSYTTTVV